MMMRSSFHISSKIAWYGYLLLVVSIVIVDAFTSSSFTLRVPTPRVLNTIVAISGASITSRSLNHRDSSTGRTSLVSLASTIGITDVWDAYNHALELHPLIVKSITASIILGLGDFAGQAVQQNMVSSDSSTTTPTIKNGVDYSRAARFAIFGLILQAPWNHYYYLLLDGQIPPTVDEPFSVTNIMKVGIDQFIQAPIFTVLIFVFLGVLEGKTFDDIKKQLQNDYPETIVANCKSHRPIEF